MKNVASLFFALTISLIVMAQDKTKQNIHLIDDYFSSQTPSSFQKLYLHTDREYYFIGDTLWFSPYLVQANNNKLLLNDCNLYVDLIDNKGQVVEKSNFILDKGMCSGYLNFNNKFIAPGTYVLRAYTDQIKPLGEDAFFQKTIKINDTQHYNQDENEKKKEDDVIFLDFYPEGGFLLDGKLNQMAFIAHNQHGQRINFKGKILTSTGDEIPIKTVYKGVGSFLFIPESNQKYKIETERSCNIKFRMPDISQQGAKLMLSKVSKKAVSFYILSSDNMPSSEFYIALFHRGIGKNYIKVEKEKLTQGISIRTDYLGAGVNRLVLLNDKFEPLSERLVFINKNNDDCLVDVNLSKNRFLTREQVKMNLSIPKTNNNDEWARVSVSVVNENMMGYQGNFLDIRSYLLLDSELKGHIQTPGLYFVDDDSISSSRKLDLLMLTNGWRNYAKEQGDVDSSNIDLGITFSGKVQKEILNKPYINTDVFLTIANNDIKKIKSTKTDKYGCFKFDSIVFFDTTLIMIQAKNYKNKNNTRLELNDLCIEQFSVNEPNYKNIDDIGGLSLEMYRLKYINELSMAEFFPDRESILLEDIVISAKHKKKTDDHFRIYTPSQSKKLTDTDQNTGSILQYLAGRFAGVQVRGDKIIIRGSGSINSDVFNGPLILLDGMPITTDELKFYPVYDIDIVEVIKGPDATIFGVRGANGVISIFTRKGSDYKPIAKKIPGTIIKKIRGFEKFRVFYSPVYTSINIEMEIPDYRQTLYWNPSVVLDDKTKSLSFFTCDNLANYKVIVEGITTSGEICIGKAGFVVDERRQRKP
jgi:hypothetical protein